MNRDKLAKAKDGRNAGGAEGQSNGETKQR